MSRERAVQRRVLFITNYPTPYRVKFFNELAKYVDLHVTYEGRASAYRNASWYQDNEYRHEFDVLQDRHTGLLGQAAALRRHVLSTRYDLVIVGCYNDPLGALAIRTLRAARQRFAINVDGEFFRAGFVKGLVRKGLLAHADAYLIAGKHTGALLRREVGASKVFPYRFASFDRGELNKAAQNPWVGGGEWLCVGRYEEYKGIDVLVDAMGRFSDQTLTLVGSNERSDELESLVRAKNRSNIRVIPYLDKKVLNRLYHTCSALVLPTRQECWGLVVNEAASFGAPIVSTRGSGAALEFLSETAPQLLAEPGDSASLAGCMETFLDLSYSEVIEYSSRLRAIAQEYSTEAMVQDHLAAIRAILT